MTLERCYQCAGKKRTLEREKGASSRRCVVIEVLIDIHYS
jgi:hypothetical protein